MHTRVHFHSSREQVRVPNVIALVGLPARGKTYISHKLCRYLNWIGIKTKAFNVGEYRRVACDFAEEGKSEFFNPHNLKAVKIRDECAKLAMQDMGKYLENKEGEVAIFDATNTTRERRKWLVEFCKREDRDPKFRIFFIESVCDDPEIINSNISEVKLNSPDYKGRMTEEQAKEDFLKRIENYKSQYEPLDEELDDDFSFIKVINAGRSFYVHNVNGHVQSRVVYFLMNIHLLPRSIYLTRHGESEYNRIGRLGGDSPLSENGLLYAQKLKEYFEKENVPGDLRIWSSQKIRAAQTANYLKELAAHVEYWKVLDEIDAGICEGLTYEDFQARYPKQFAERDKDKYHYRYPSGESYEDLVARLEPVIMELERQSNVLVVSHQAVLRCILAYFDNKNREELPYLNVPLHTVIKLTPKAYSCQIEMFKFKIEAVDTYRAKPTEPVTIPTAKGETILPSQISSPQSVASPEQEKQENGLIEDYHAPRLVVGQSAEHEMDSAEFIDDPLIVVSWTSTVALGVISAGLFGEGKRKLNGIWMNLVLLGVVIAAFINLSFRVNKPILDLPYYCYLRVWDGSFRRACIILFFMTQLIASIAFCALQSLQTEKASTTQRKFFHLTIALIALGGIIYDPAFIRLSAHLMLQIFVILELLRIFKATPWSQFLNTSLPIFIDPAQESEALILTPILLIAGVFLPIFLSPIDFEKGNVMELKHLAGIATVGVGDSLAAIVGSRYGRTKLPKVFRRHKSLEGSLAMFVGQVGFYSLILISGLVPYSNWELFRLTFAIVICTLIEAASKIGDNIVLPLAAWVIL